MHSPVLDDPRLDRFLCDVDSDFAATARGAGCPQCGAVLHSARYPRKVRGRAMQAEDGRNHRASFCCSRDGCRRRVTPPSVRFLGRKHFLSSTVLLVSAARYGARPRLAQTLRDTYGVSHCTLARWQRWWRETVPATMFWAAAKTHFMPPIDRNCLPVELVKRFAASSGPDRLLAVLRFIATLPSALTVVATGHDTRCSHGARRV